MHCQSIQELTFCISCHLSNKNVFSTGVIILSSLRFAAKSATFLYALVPLLISVRTSSERVLEVTLPNFILSAVIESAAICSAPIILTAIRVSSIYKVSWPYVFQAVSKSLAVLADLIDSPFNFSISLLRLYWLFLNSA